LDRRLYMQLLAFSGCHHPEILVHALERAALQGVLYEDLNDPRGVAVLAVSESPDYFIENLRPLLNTGPFGSLTRKAEMAFFGRTYALGYEPALEDWLLHRPRRVVLDPACQWAVWYPLRRTGAFAQLSRQEQGQILREHGAVGRRFGDAGLAHDIRLACAGLDVHDNDFVIGLIAEKLHPLSFLIQAMRGTQQTSKYIQSMGPFFVGRALWRSPAPAAPAAAEA
ncbi:MAG: chlorite dismutase family protein, partial [Elusimicrobia bacterium]|nr:chlorite dismutase family protein [Elusimicrobiota bacterium]